MFFALKKNLASFWRVLENIWESNYSNYSTHIVIWGTNWAWNSWMELFLRAAHKSRPIPSPFLSNELLRFLHHQRSWICCRPRWYPCPQWGMGWDSAEKRRDSPTKLKTYLRQLALLPHPRLLPPLALRCYNSNPSKSIGHFNTESKNTSLHHSQTRPASQSMWPQRPMQEQRVIADASINSSVHLQ